MRLRVNQPQRQWKMRAHTATHLLHAHLDSILNWTKQSWSLVDTEFLRFDFSATQPLTDEQMKDIEESINSQITQNLPVDVNEMSKEEWLKAWAKAFFEDKYGETVRVVSIWSTSSVELCWWTHVSSTGQIWAFCILWQEAVASWIRRITAATGPWVFAELSASRQLIDSLWSLLDASPKQLTAKLTKLLNDQESLRAENDSLRSRAVWWTLKWVVDWATGWVLWEQALTHIIPYTWDLWTFTIKEVVGVLKNNQDLWSWLLIGDDWAFALSSNGEFNAKELLSSLWVRWGWSDRFVQWKDWSIASKLSA